MHDGPGGDVRDPRQAREKKAAHRVHDESSSETMAFSVVSDVWTWSIDVQEMQFMFNNLHHPNIVEAAAGDTQGALRGRRRARRTRTPGDRRPEGGLLRHGRRPRRGTTQKGAVAAARAPRKVCPRCPRWKKTSVESMTWTSASSGRLNTRSRRKSRRRTWASASRKEDGKTHFESTLFEGNVLSIKKKDGDGPGGRRGGG